MPAPMTMPHRRCRPCRPRQAIAITSALSPDNSTLIQMILPTASQNEGRCRSAWNWVKNAPILAGSKICKTRFTTYPLPAQPLSRPAASADDLVAREELRDLDHGGLRRIRPVHRVLADRLRVQLADGAVGGLGRIGRAHHVAIFGDRALAFKHLHHDGTRGHELDEFAEERPRLVHGIEGLGLAARHADALLRDDAKARLLDQRVDRASQIARGRVGLDDREGALSRHDLWSSN